MIKVKTYEGYGIKTANEAQGKSHKEMKGRMELDVEIISLEESLTKNRKVAQLSSEKSVRGLRLLTAVKFTVHQ